MIGFVETNHPLNGFTEALSRLGDQGWGLWLGGAQRGLSTCVLGGAELELGLGTCVLELGQGLEGAELGLVWSGP